MSLCVCLWLETVASALALPRTQTHPHLLPPTTSQPPHTHQVESEEYQLKPMNCPFHVAMYKDGAHSYRDLPLRWAELGTVYR